ncbi:hypothetical protein [Paenibacillus sp. Soil522]|uniref:hypothetical protein n=1 Tax=Paenibacillus sp. Soil522 TaxID=1736388 RepID=UPI000A8B9EE6|nr:hypothetical protein [Paenibacillus sp. Soil522]
MEHPINTTGLEFYWIVTLKRLCSRKGVQKLEGGVETLYLEAVLTTSTRPDSGG